VIDLEFVIAFSGQPPVHGLDGGGERPLKVDCVGGGDEGRHDAGLPVSAWPLHAGTVGDEDGVRQGPGGQAECAVVIGSRRA
jgi:hypothetical protein